jgi:xanthine dehydrogenase accessory factor
MKEIFDEVEAWWGSGEEIAMATLVAVRGSAPRRPGARLAVTRSGKMTGSISGGCVESDLIEKAMEVLRDAKPRMETYGISDEQGFEVGLSCGGSIDVLLETLARDESLVAVCEALQSRRPVALGIACDPPSLRGRRVAVFASDRSVGSIDRELDESIEAAARPLLPTGGTRLLALAWRDCEARVFLEAFAPPSRLFIVGATHAAVALCRMAKLVGFYVTVVDPRSIYASPERLPEADEIRRAWPEQALDENELDEYSYLVSLTHDVKFDHPTLVKALRSSARYVGAIGSRATHERRRQQLREQGFTDGDLSRIRSPIGLDIGSRTPEEIAVSILAEMLSVRYGRDAAPLKDRKAAIHADAK